MNTHKIHLHKILDKIFGRAVAVGFFALVPAVAFAATKDLSWLIKTLTGYLNSILVLMMGAAVVIFVFYVIRYFILSTDKRAEAGQYVMYSIIGFFVILSFWGLVNILQNTFGLQNENNRPTSWNSFSNLFPDGSGSSGSGGGGGTFSGSGTTGSSVYNGTGGSIGGSGSTYTGPNYLNDTRTPALDMYNQTH